MSGFTIVKKQSQLQAAPKIGRPRLGPKPPPGPKRQLFTIKEAAQMLNLGLSTVYKMNRAGKIKFVKIGSATRVSLLEIERLVKHGTE